MTSEEAKEQPIINITGEKVALGPWSRAILPVQLRWDNDFLFSTLGGDSVRPRTKESLEADYERVKDDRERAIFAIYERAALRPIGLTNLRDIDHVHRTAEFGIGIGERDCWGKGYGTEATILVLDYVFNVLGLHNVLLDTTTFNERAVRAYTRAGFREIGRRRQAHRVGDNVYDVIFMDCVATEFHSPLPRIVEMP